MEMLIFSSFLPKIFEEASSEKFPKSNQKPLYNGDTKELIMLYHLIALAFFRKKQMSSFKSVMGGCEVEITSEFGILR